MYIDTKALIYTLSDNICHIEYPCTSIEDGTLIQITFFNVAPVRKTNSDEILYIICLYYKDVMIRQM